MSWTGRGIRVAIIDSGVNPAHPHVGVVSGGVGIGLRANSSVYLDYLGHGTAVAGAVRETAPDAELYAVKVFDRSLSTSIEKLLRAIDWALEQRADLINVSLGTDNPDHRPAFEEAIHCAERAGAILVAAAAGESLPGALPRVLRAAIDPSCPRGDWRWRIDSGRTCFHASGYARPIPGVPPEQNLNGISFAVARLTGFAARVRQARPGATLETVEQLLMEWAPAGGVATG